LGESGLFTKSQRELILVKEGEQLLKKLKDPKLIRSLANRMKTKAVFIVLKEKLDKSALQKEPYKTLLELGDSLEAKKLDKRKVREMVKNKVEKSGKKIEEKALDYLLEIAGDDLLFLRGEVEKLILYAEREITLEDVKKVCITQKESDLFEFLDAFFSKDLEKSLLSLSSIFRMGIHPLVILATLVNYTLRLLTVKKSQGKTEDILGELGVKHPFAIHNHKRYLSNFTEQDLERLLERLYWLDVSIKTFFNQPEKTITNMVIDYLAKVETEAPLEEVE
jgi:DNA polymerase III, delta subunit